MEIDYNLKELKNAIETYKELRMILNIETQERCNDFVLDRKFRKKYGLEVTELSSAIIQVFYEIGKEDAKKEILNQLNNINNLKENEKR